MDIFYQFCCSSCFGRESFRISRTGCLSLLRQSTHCWDTKQWLQPVAWTHLFFITRSDSRCSVTGWKTPKLSISWGIWTQSFWPTRLTHPNDISIGSAVSAGLTNVTDIHTDRARFCLSGVMFGKYVGALPCLNAVDRLPSHTKLSSSKCKHTRATTSR